MSRKVREIHTYLVKNKYDDPKYMKVFLKRIENESIRNVIRKSSSTYSNKSEGKLAKEINFSDVY